VGNPHRGRLKGRTDLDLRLPGLVGKNQASLEPATCDVLGGAFGSRRFVMKEITLHRRTSEAISKMVENPSNRENEDADPMPPMKAMGAT